MKKFTLVVMALLALAFSVKAQQYVSTEPSNRNVILEEFTGRTCTWCPSGHVIANNIAGSHPNRFWSVNIHSEGYFSATSYPNLNTAKGNSIRAAFSATSFPSGVVNRSTASAVGRGEWSGQANTQFNQAAECNLGGVAKVNPDTRNAEITVEVYYTGNSSSDENYLTIMMLQDSIWGSQTGGSDNPAQYVNGQYCHMHIFRDIITANMGDVIAPTTQGSLITKTYNYQIPEVIGSPNGVEVDLDNIHFVAFVSERYQGTPTRPILNACQLVKTTISDQPIYPIISEVAQVVNASCGLEKDFAYTLTNIGTDPLTSVRFSAQVAGATQEFEWTGELQSGDNTKMDFSMEVPFGSFNGTLDIVEANGQPFEASKSFTAESLEWIETECEGETTTIKIYIIQDQWGEQTTWDLINSAGEAVAQGGPYQHLAGSGSTQVNVEIVNDLPANDCYLFRIYDSNDNGICCNYGNGYYYIKDAKGNKFIEGDGDFGSEARNLFTIKNNMTEVESVSQESLKVYPNPADEYLTVEGEMTSVEVYNTIGQCLFNKTVNGNSTRINLSEFSNGIYLLRVNNNGEVTTRKFSVNR